MTTVNSGACSWNNNANDQQNNFESSLRELRRQNELKKTGGNYIKN
jgi:hypothetical protein